MKISFFETRTRNSFNLVLRDENENFFFQSRVSRREREIENHFSWSSEKKSSWFSREFPLWSGSRGPLVLYTSVRLWTRTYALKNWCCWCADAAEMLMKIMRWCCWYCWCADAVDDALMLLMMRWWCWCWCTVHPHSIVRSSEEREAPTRTMHAKEDTCSCHAAIWDKKAKEIGINAHVTLVHGRTHGMWR